VIADDHSADGYGRSFWLWFWDSCVFIVVVVAPRLAAVSYDEGNV
jgi:hypothetical protein